MKIEEINFIAVRPATKETGDIFLGFVNLETDEFQLNSIGIFQNLDGKMKLTFPAKKLVNASLKFYFRPNTEKIYQQIFQAIEAYLKEIKIFDNKDNYELNESTNNNDIQAPSF